MPDNRYGHTLKERLFSRLIFNPETGCLLWAGRLDSCGYGRVGAQELNGRRGQQEVHRVAYQVFVGPIPDGLELDHLCEVKRCASPDHLEPVTHRENIRRMYARKCARKADAR